MWPFRNQSAPRVVNTSGWNWVAQQNVANLAHHYGAQVVQHGNATVFLPGGSDDHKRALHRMLDRYQRDANG